MLVLIGMLAWGLAGCDTSGNGAAPGGDVGLVNGEPIDANDFNKRVDLTVSQYQSQYQAYGIDLYSEEYADLYHSIEDMCFDYMVSEILLEQEAAAQDIVPDQAYIDAQLEYIKESANIGGVDGYQLYLNQLGVDEAFLVKEIRTSTLYEQLTAPLIADITVSDEEVRAYYDEQASGVEIYHILMADEAEAEAVLKRVKDGEDFAALAAEFGTDGTASIGGALGVGNANSQWVEEFKTPALTLGPNEIYPELVVSEHGFHIIKSGAAVTGSEEEYAEQYETLKTTVLNQKQNEVINAWMEELEAAADIKDQRKHNH
ncbi:MAG: peptidylprolyl isomerase [Syntrophomonadaceae bacterium]|nr:peptidylprolyl isomerase [Syntrophomonadaceae bacterium]